MEAGGAGTTGMGDGGSSDSISNICIKDVFSFRVAEQVMYCRLCATVSNDAISIFGPEGIKRNLADKINVALPIWVSKNMGPPLHVCLKCIEVLDVTTNFINQVVAAQKKINCLFKVLKDHSKPKVPSTKDKDASRPTFITYFRANKLKKLDVIKRAGNHEAEKENEGGQQKAHIGQTPKKANDSASSLAAYRPSNSDKTETANKILEEIFSTQTISSGEKSLNSENNSIPSHAPVVDLTDDNSDNSLGGDDIAEDFDAPIDDDETRVASTSAGNDEPAVTLVDNDEPVITLVVNENCAAGDPKSNSHSPSELYDKVCKYCNQSFNWNTELIFHQTSAHKDVVFCCRVCFKVFYDDREEFSKHVLSHTMKGQGKSTEITNENANSNPDYSIEPTGDDSCVILNENKTPRVRLNYICKYCSNKYSRLKDLFSHQTESHSDVVFRCSICLKVFYENVEELHKHEESHGMHKPKYKRSNSRVNLSEIDNLREYHTEEQREWIKKILSGGPERTPDKNITATITVGSKKNVNANTANNNAGNVNNNVSPSVNINTASSLAANTGTLSGSEEIIVSFKNVAPTPVKEFISSQPRTLTTPYKYVHYRVKHYYCKACQIEFKSEEERELHRLFHHKLKLPCRFCPRTLAGKRKLVDHEASHFKKPKILCRKCGLQFDDLEILKQHKRTQCIIQQLPRFSCQICKRLYIRESELKIHLETHLDERPFLCEKCGQCFRDVPSLREHRSTPCKTKGFTRGYNCDICQKNFSNARLLASHRLHYHKAMYPCPLCGLVFRSRLTMTSHMKNHSEILCLVCNESFESLDNLQNHRKKEHPDEDMTEFSAFDDDIDATSVPKLKCIDCDKCYATERTLNIHEATHSSELAWKCRLCGENFVSEVKLKDHMSSHPGEQPHKCGICDQTFSLHKSLVEHEKQHFQEDSRACEKCGKTFSTTVELSKHYAEHTSYNAFTCPFCPMSFSRKISLIIHQRTHLTRVYSCSLCNEKFSQQKLLQEHEKTHGKRKGNSPVPAHDVDEDALAASLLDMSEAVVGVSNEDHILEEIIPSVNISNSNERRADISSNIILDPEYEEVVYVSHALEDIL